MVQRKEISLDEATKTLKASGYSIVKPSKFYCLKDPRQECKASRCRGWIEELAMCYAVAEVEIPPNPEVSKVGQ